MRGRRFLTIPAYFLAWLVWLGAMPVWLPLAIVVDGARRNRGIALRCATLVGVYLSCELIGIAAAFCLWAGRFVWHVDAQRWTELHFRLEAWWGSTLLRAVVRLFGLRLEVEGENEGDPDLDRGPYLLLLRHASSGDTLLASALVSSQHGIRLRYVLKKELLWDPCLDIVGNRLPNAFVDRFSDDSAREVQRVQQLARDLGPRDGVLIYPEGTRFSPSKYRRVLDRLHRQGDTKLLEYARSLTFVLPPRPGGVLGLLEAAPKADVVICAHTGFEGAASLARIWSGALLHRVIRVQFRRIPREQIPSRRDERVEWVFDQWRRVDAWVGVRSVDAINGSYTNT